MVKIKQEIDQIDQNAGLPLGHRGQGQVHRQRAHPPAQDHCQGDRQGTRAAHPHFGRGGHRRREPQPLQGQHPLHSVRGNIDVVSDFSTDY